MAEASLQPVNTFKQPPPDGTALCASSPLYIVVPTYVHFIASKVV
jgi:hypothetical protein